MAWDAPRTFVTGEPFPHSRAAIRRAGDRIRKSAESAADPKPADLLLLNEFRSWHYPTLEQVQRPLTDVFHGRLGLDPQTVTIGARPLKTPEAIIAKLVRSKTRLTHMQDIAGARIVVPALEVQDAMMEALLRVFGHAHPKVMKADSRAADELGYRAVHVVVELDERLAEIQLRTEGQELWAQLVESIDSANGSDLKHGDGPTDIKEWLKELSAQILNRELGKPATVPPLPPTLKVVE